MINYLVRRLMIGVVTLFCITFLIYTLIRSMPGDPTTLLRAEADPSRPIDQREIERMRKTFGLDKPVPLGYAHWLGNLTLRGDMGRSIFQKKSVFNLIKDKIGPTLLWSVPSLSLAFLLAIPIGLWSTVRSGRLDERGVSTILYMLYSLPTYVAALFLLMVFSVWLDDTILEMPLGNMTSRGYETFSFFGKMMDRLWHIILPVVCLTYGGLAFDSRFIKANMEEAVRQDYIRTARAKGVSERKIIYHHAFRNTLIPFVTLLGLTLPSLVSGAIILEQIFTWNGIGRLFIDALSQRDYPIIMGLTLMFSALTLLGQLVADVLYAFVDPRVTYS